MTREHLDAVGELHQRRNERNSPSAPSRAPTARSGRATSPTNSESPVSTSHGSSPRERSVRRGSNAPAGGRANGRAKRDRADLISSPSPSGIVWVVDASLGMELTGRRARAQAAVSRDVVGMSMRLDHADEPHALPVGRGKQRLDCNGGSTTTATSASSSPTGNTRTRDPHREAAGRSRRDGSTASRYRS